MVIYARMNQASGHIPSPWIEEAPRAGLSRCEASIGVCVVILVGVEFEPEWIT